MEMVIRAMLDKSLKELKIGICGAGRDEAF